MTSPVKPDANLHWRPRADQPRYRSVVKAFGHLSGYREETARRKLRDVQREVLLIIRAFRMVGQEDRLCGWFGPIMSAFKFPGNLPAELLPELKREYREALIREQWTRLDYEHDESPRRWRRWQDAALLVVHVIYGVIGLEGKQWEAA